jgi:FlaA1/EpsC-like NDP-sugar epimerase
MGASKRLSELVLQGLARLGGSTRFCMVRFGNVMGSSGSVVPLFRKQIAAGGPITVTHLEITRYFMTIPEAAQLVIQAGSMGVGGEVYVLDMGQPVKIIDLARRMVNLSGLTLRNEKNVDGDIAIEIVGLRPGEKLYEELLIGDDVEGTSHPLIMRAYEHELPWALLDARLTELDGACQSFDYEKVLNILASLVQEYTPALQEDCELLWHALVDFDHCDVVRH